ncbi:ATP-binding protein [candidate division KSB1 bacterium]|nr:ATP-binding protein [candidate division KSB1 bacterium]
MWKDRRTQEGNNTLIPIRVSGELYGGSKYDFEVNLRFNRFSVQINSSDPPLLQTGALNIALIPGYTGFNPREERRTAVVRRELRALGQSGTIIRNILLDLRENAERWKRFIDVLQSIFPGLHLFEPEFEEQVDRYIRVTYSEGELLPLPRRKKTTAFDIFSSGSGFHQFLQILSGILVEQTSTVLLDEPDAHLFSKLQAELYGVLKLLRDDGIQVVAATHSTELIAAASPEQIISFTHVSPHRLHVQTEVLNTVENLGGLENLALLLIDSYRKVVIVEDKYDESLLHLFVRQILGDQEYAQLQSRLIFLHHHTRPNGATVKKMLDTLCQAFRSTKPVDVKAFVVADRDYALDEQLVQELEKYARHESPFAANQTWHIWQRAEIENYLLVPDAIVRAVRNAAPTPSTPSLFEPTKEKVWELLDHAVEASREAVRKRLIDAFHDRNRLEKLGWQASTVTEKAEEFLAQIWHGDQRYTWCDAKKVVLPRLRDAIQKQYDITVTDRAIVEALTPNDVPEDLRRAVKKLVAFLE